MHLIKLTSYYMHFKVESKEYKERNDTMKTITIRQVPDDLHRLITRIAKKNHRSVQQQMLLLLEKARALDIESPCEKARSMREKFKGRDLGNTVDEIRQERER